ncbi:hypothetical protein [Shewanella maritima]|uniref:HzsA-related protein n=1 Tax=Shewanella maritima TaxID=2520507 RepID=UPI0037368ACA
MTRSKADKALLLLNIALLSACDTETAIRDQQPDPVLVEYPVVYIQRSLNTDQSMSELIPPQFELRNPARFNPGASLHIKQNAFADAIERNLTTGLFSEVQVSDEETAEPAIDIRDLSVSDDGMSFLVSIRAPEIEDAEESEQPTWNIWRYDLATDQLNRVITSDNVAAQGQDLMASFLPDGRILFASTRQKLSRAILLDEGKPQYTALDEQRDQYTFNIHVMDEDGSNIEQLSFNLSHDFSPLVLQNGKILYSRLDAMGGDHGINLYIMNPDGTNSQLVFGWHSHQVAFDGQTSALDYVGTQQLPNGDVFMLLTGDDDTAYQKRPVTINITDFIDNEQPSLQSNVDGNAINDIAFESYDFNFSPELSSQGRITHLFPLPDNSQRYLLSWDLCKVIVEEQVRSCGQLSAEQLADENLIQAQANFELWLYDDQENTQQLVTTPEENNVLTESIVMQPTLYPKAFIADKVVGDGLDAQMVDQLAGAIHIRSVYDFDGQDASISADNPGGFQQLMDPLQTRAQERPARFLRVIRGVPMPDDDVRDIPNTDFGRSNNQLMREIVGYTPIQPDGSVQVKIPANVPVAISILDINGHRIGGRHQQWFSVRPGETLQCIGCHTANSTLPHGRVDAQAEPINIGATSAAPFPNTRDIIVPDIGQTMAQALASLEGIAELSSDLVYTDKWTPASSTLNPDLAHRYSALLSAAPNGSDCYTQWNAYCRIQINYQEHIQPIWDVQRQTFDEITGELLVDNTCSTCHSRADADGVAQVPAGQLELVATPSTDEPAHYTSYRELFFNDIELEEVEGILVDRLIVLLDADGNIVYQVDSDGELILDENGQPIPVMVTVPVNSILRVNGARASSAFFNVMQNDTHLGILNNHEQRLISEWLDIGAQYYNTPFYVEE